MKHGIVLKVGIVRFPGSNCDFDTLKFFQNAGHRAEFIWHKETRLRAWDLIVLPGGFAFGDRMYTKATGAFSIEPGTQALHSPVMKIVRAHAQKGRPILGICNGFQILVKAGLLPGALEQNSSKKFYCDWTACTVAGQSFFGDPGIRAQMLHIPVAHGWGRYTITPMHHKKLSVRGQIFLRYKGFNPNGSFDNIAGICNEQGTIFGMMPHPERTSDGVFFMRAMERYAVSARRTTA